MRSWRNFWGLRQTSSVNTENARIPWFRMGKNAPFVSEDTSMQVAAFYSGLIYISTQIAKLPWEVKDKKNKTLDEDRIAVLLSLAPNEEMNAFNFRLQMIQNTIIHGNAYAEIERDGINRPVNLWPLRSQDVVIDRDPKTKKLIYRVMNQTGGETILAPKDVYHLRNFHTKDGIVGQGVVAYARDTLGIGLGSEKMARNLFSNGGIPSGFLKVKGKLSPDASKRLKDSWESAHGGDSSGGTAVLEEDASYEALTMDPEVMQFLESRKFTVLEVARFLRIPPTKLYEITAANFSNQEQSNLEVVTDILDSWACNLEMEADVKLLSNRFGGKYTMIDLYSILRGDMKTRAEYFAKMLQNGAMTPNEIRTLEGKPPYDEGDKFYIAANNFTPIDRLDEVIDSQISKGQPTDVGVGAKEADQQLTSAAIKFLKG